MSEATVTVTFPGREPVTFTGPVPEWARIPEPEPTPEPVPAVRVLMWVGWTQVLNLTDSQLDQLAGYGFDGFICSTRHLPQLGASRATWDGLAAATVSTRLVERCAERGLQLHLAHWCVDYNRTVAPFGGWVDDVAWSSRVLPAVSVASSMAHDLGMVGVWLDQEAYPGAGGVEASWKWTATGLPEPQARELIARRGAQVADAILDGYPAAELGCYHLRIQGGWDSHIQEVKAGRVNVYGSWTMGDFWRGILSVDGFMRRTSLSSTFYKSTQDGTPWADAIAADQNGTRGALAAAGARADLLAVTPFVWINSDPRATSQPQYPPDYVAAQMRECGRAAEGTVGVYHWDRLAPDFYAPYADAVGAAHLSA